MTGKQVLLVLSIVLLFLAPTVVADAWSTQGSEAYPHVLDAKGNVHETADWPGMGLAPRPHMDVLAAWMEYLPNGMIGATIKLENLTNMHYAAESWDLYYRIEAGVFRGEKPVCWLDICYTFVLEARKRNGAEEFQWQAWYSWPETPGVYPVVPRDQSRVKEEIPVTGKVEIGVPGYIRFWFPLADLAQHGDRLYGFHVESREYSYLGPVHTGWQVYNEASSKSAFALSGWEREHPLASRPMVDPVSVSSPGSAPLATSTAPLPWMKGMPPTISAGEEIPVPAAGTYQWLSLAGLLGLVAVIRARFTLLAIAALFTRINLDETLDHPRRAALVELVRQNPGATFARLRSMAGVGSGSLAYHLAVLERHRLLRSVMTQGRRHYFVPGQSVDVPGSSSPTAAIAQALRVVPGGSAKDVAQRAGLTRTGALYHLRRLESRGQVRSQKDDRTRRFYLL